MKKSLFYMLFVIVAATMISACDENQDNANLSITSTAGITVGGDTPTLSLLGNAGNNVECSIDSEWLRNNFVSIEAAITIEGVYNVQDYYTRALEATATQWGLSITTADSETGLFYIYMEAPTSTDYRYLPAVLTVVVTDINGDQTKTLRSINVEGEASVEVAGIPEDSIAGETPVIVENTVTLPDFTCAAEVDEASGYHVVNINITGISDGEGGYLELKGTSDEGQNVWLEFDQIAKGISVTKVSTDSRAMNDIVFLVDNSGSMGDEANGIATSIIAWAEELNAAGIDAQYGCVGYNGNVTGAINLSDVESLSTYLNSSYGTSRTVGFNDDDLYSSASLSEYTTTSGECAVVALRFANDLFNFRSGSNRIYVNFTDEPNQTGGDADNSVEYVNNSTWSGKGTIHTVYSATSCNTSTTNYEDPRLLSTYTGGTSMDVDASFTGVTLSSLPVSEAIQNSYIIQFTNIEQYIGTEGSYDVVIVVKDGGVQSAKSVSIGL